MLSSANSHEGHEQQQVPQAAAVAEQPVDDEQGAEHGRRRFEVGAPVGESQQDADEEHEPDHGSHRDSYA